MTWALFFAPVAVSGVVMLFASVVLTDESEEPPELSAFFERDHDSDLEPVALSVQRPHDESEEEIEDQESTSSNPSEREPRRAMRGIVDSSRDRAPIPALPSSPPAGVDESASDDEQGEDLSPEERRARTEAALRAISERQPNLKNVPGFGVLKRLEKESESQGEAPPSEQEPAPVSMGGARGR